MTNNLMKLVFSVSSLNNYFKLKYRQNIPTRDKKKIISVVTKYLRIAISYSVIKPLY